MSEELKNQQRPTQLQGMRDLARALDAAAKAATSLIYAMRTPYAPDKSDPTLPTDEQIEACVSEANERFRDELRRSVDAHKPRRPD